MTPTRIIKSQQKIKRGKKLFQYEPSQIVNALAAVRSDKWQPHVPDSTGKVGRSPVLNRDVENKLVEWLINISKMGFPIGKEAGRENKLHLPKILLAEDTINANLHSNATDDMPVDHIDEYSPVIGAVDVAVDNNTSVTVVGESHIDDSKIEFDFPEYNTDANFDANSLNVIENPNDIRFSEMKQIISETPKTSS
ncbi:hypothetical protein JTB14_009600 [Gonioctena quinquepunctata]|nr:hypothetical protein JTB14_009600 [Gonioctena quinquepunctata]